MLSWALLALAARPLLFLACSWAGIAACGW